MIVALLIVAAQLAPTPFIGTKKARVEGESFLVTIKSSGEVVVASKAFVTGPTVRRRLRMMEAVRGLTGCELVDVMDYSKLRGFLQCPAK